MQTPKNLKEAPQKKKRKRILRLVSVFIVVLIMLVVILVPVLVSSEKGREIILAKINNSIDGKTNFAGLSMGWFKGIKVRDVSFNDHSGRTSIAVKQISTKPHYGSILFGSMSLGKTIIDEPKVEINLRVRQPEEIEKSERKMTTDKQSTPIVLPTRRVDLVVKDGNLKVTAPQAGTVEIARINSKLNLRPPGQRTDFDLAMIVVKQDHTSKISTEGHIEPGTDKGWTLKGTSGDLTIKVEELDLDSLEPLLTWAGVELEAEGKVSADIKSQMKDGRFENLSADIKAEKLDITGKLLKGDRLKTGTLDVQAKLARQQKMIHIENLDITADWLTARAKGMVPATFESLSESLQSDSNLSGNFELDVARIFSQMPQTFSVKEGMKVKSGKLNGTVSTATKDGKRKVAGNVTLAELKGTIDDKSITLQQPVKAQADITAEKDKVIFDNVGLTASFGKIDCTGTSEALKYNANINLASLQSELGQFIDIGKYKMSGELSANGDASIGKDKVATSGSSTVKNLRLSLAEDVSAAEPMANITYSVVAEPNKGILNIGSIKANASLGEVNINNAVVPLNKKAQKPMQLAVSANKVDLKKVQPFAVLMALLPKEMQLAGIVQSDVSISSEKRAYRILTDSTHIKNLKVIYLEKKPFEANDVSINFDAEVDPEQKTINVKRLQLISPQIKIYKGELSQVSKDGKTKLEGRIDCEYDWAAVSTITGPYLPQGLRLEGQRKDAISFDSEYPAGQKDKLLENLNTKANVGFKRAEYMGLNFGPTDVDIQIQNGLLKIAPFSTTVNNGQLNFAAEADFKKKPTLLKSPQPIEVRNVEINEVMSRKLLVYVNPIFLNAVDVNGVANFSAEQIAIPLTSASKNQLEIAGTIDIDKLKLKPVGLLGLIFSAMRQRDSNVKMKIHPTRFGLQNGRLQYEDMQLDIGDNPVNFKGAIGLDKSLNMTVTLPYTLGGRTARIGDKTVDRISLPLTGTINKPELDLGKLLEDQAIKKGLELLEDLLK